MLEHLFGGSGGVVLICLVEVMAWGLVLQGGPQKTRDALLGCLHYDVALWVLGDSEFASALVALKFLTSSFEVLFALLLAQSLAVCGCSSVVYGAHTPRFI